MDLETLIREKQDELRGYPLPPPTWRDRLRERLPDWRYFNGAPMLLTIAAACMFISAALQLFVILAR